MQLNRSILKILLCSFLSSPSIWSQDLETLEDDFAYALKSNSVYDGIISWGSEGHGAFCDTYEDGELEFTLTLEDVTVDIDEQGVVTFDIIFDKSFASLYYERKTGVLCVPVHSRGEVHMSKVRATIRLIPLTNPEAQEAKLRIPALQVSGLKFTKVYVGSGKHELGGDLPEWANQWIETKFNSAMEKFLKTKVAERLTDYLIARLEERLRDRGRPPSEGSDPLPAPAPNPIP